MYTPDESSCAGLPAADYAVIAENRRRELARWFAAHLPSGARFVWEVGCGHGHFLTAYAAAHPVRTCVGVDIQGERVARSARKRDRARLANLHFVRAEASMFLATLPPDAAPEHIFILFPDPWPKLRHHKHRVLQAAFLDQLATRAAPDARLYFRTDHQDYFSFARATFDAHARWQLADEPWPFEFETVFQQRAPQHHSLVARLRS